MGLQRPTALPEKIGAPAVTRYRNPRKTFAAIEPPGILNTVRPVPEEEAIRWG
jgi:hypothetical protein